MSKSVFVSFVFEDKVDFERVTRWAEEGMLGPDIVATGETKDVRQEGEGAIEKHLKPRIRGAAAVLLLLGNNTHNHDWVRYELSVAKSFNKKVIVCRIQDTTGLAPEGFRDLKVIALDPTAIKTALG